MFSQGLIFSFFPEKGKDILTFSPATFPFVILGIERIASVPRDCFTRKGTFVFFLFIAVIGEIKLSSSSNLFLLYSYRQHFFLRIVESPDVAKIFAA